MKGLYGVQTGIVAVTAMLVLCSPAVAERQLYQWVDASGNVMYGDSPPTVTHSRTVDPATTDGPVREIPDYLVERKPAVQEVMPDQAVPEKEVLLEALNRLESVMSRMQELTDQVDTLEAERNHLLTQSAARSGGGEIVRGAKELALQVPVKASHVSTSIPKSAPRPEVTSTNPPTVLVDSGLEAPTMVPPMAQHLLQPASEAIKVDGAAAEAAVAQVSFNEVADLDHKELDGEAIIGSQPLLEVAVPEPQPIRSQMSAKERVRSRWQSENRAQQRFLKRLSQQASSSEGHD